MISTGAHSILPPIKNIDTKGVFTLKEFSDGLNREPLPLKITL